MIWSPDQCLAGFQVETEPVSNEGYATGSGASMAAVCRDGEGEDSGSFAYKLKEDITPEPDKPVLILDDRLYQLERGWCLRIYLSLLVMVVLADLVGSALLPAHLWMQMRPEVQSIRTSLFQVGVVIFAYYFGMSQGRRQHSTSVHSSR